MGILLYGIFVSNSPCGVESRSRHAQVLRHSFVSNSPCGVESLTWSSSGQEAYLFLIHRVELKELKIGKTPNYELDKVSNSPCGVESAGRPDKTGRFF